MENVTLDSYNPHSLITLKKIINTESGDVEFNLYKATELETVLDEATRRNNLISQRIEAQEKQLGQIIDKLTVNEWYDSNITKEEVLKDLCEILGHEPTTTLNWSVTISVSGSTEVNLAEVEDFDLRYFLDDNLHVDSNDFTTNVDSWHIEDVDSQDWD
jgi:hypothetical protein